MEKSVFMEEVKTQNLGNFELGTQEGVNFTVLIFVSFQQEEIKVSKI